MSKFKPGDPKPAASGRKKGVLNKTTAKFNDMMNAVLFDDPVITRMRLEQLRDSGDTQDRATFWRMAAKLLPQAVNIDVKGDVLVTLDFSGGRDGSKGQESIEAENLGSGSG